MLEVAICPKCGEVNYPALDKKCYCCWVGFLKRPRKLLLKLQNNYSESTLNEMFWEAKRLNIFFGMKNSLKTVLNMIIVYMKNT